MKELVGTRISIFDAFGNDITTSYNHTPEDFFHEHQHGFLTICGECGSPLSAKEKSLLLDLGIDEYDMESLIDDGIQDYNGTWYNDSPCWRLVSEKCEAEISDAYKITSCAPRSLTARDEALLKIFERGEGEEVAEVMRRLYCGGVAVFDSYGKELNFLESAAYKFATDEEIDSLSIEEEVEENMMYVAFPSTTLIRLFLSYDTAVIQPYLAPVFGGMSGYLEYEVAHTTEEREWVTFFDEEGDENLENVEHLLDFCPC